MFCDQCGSRLAESQRFCPSCGKTAKSAPLMPVQSRISGHIRLLGIFWIAISAFRLVPGLVLTVFLGNRVYNFLPPDVPAFVPGLLGFIGSIFLVVAAVGILAGWGLLERQPWARTLAIVLGCFSLLDMPFGTALGVYTMWVLLPARSEEEYRQISRVA